MSDRPADPSALDRLAALDRRPAPAGRPVKGSPGLQLLGSIVVPGIPSLRRRPLLGLLLFVAGVAGPIVLAGWVVANRDDLVGFALDPRFLTAVMVIGLTVVAVRLAAVAEVAYAFRRTRAISAKTTLATLIVLALAVPIGWAALQANEARAVVADVFVGGSDEALYSNGDPDGVTNVLLLGGDEGPGRWGMRTDTMIVVSIDEASGRTALVSVPRNLVGLEFPPGTPMAERFPDGFNAYDGLANAVFTYVVSDQALMDQYDDDGLLPQAVALSQGIGYSLGIDIDDYALVNMQGFADVVDAIGGVTVELSGSVPLPPSAGCQVPASIGPGVVEMDGCLAISYVRSRSADSDYQRMQRQRQVLSAIGTQVSPGDALGAFGSMAGVLGDSVRTSLSSSEFSSLLDRLGDNAAIGESIGLAPPLIQPGNPDYDQIKLILDAVLNYVATSTPSGFAS